MTTCIYLENVLGSGQVVTLIEDFGDYSVRRNLQPGENVRLIVSPFKTISVQEAPLAGSRPLPRKDLPSIGLAMPEALLRRGAGNDGADPGALRGTSAGAPAMVRSAFRRSPSSRLELAVE
jgi:hypothetical protein